MPPALSETEESSDYDKKVQTETAKSKVSNGRGQSKKRSTDISDNEEDELVALNKKDGKNAKKDVPEVLEVEKDDEEMEGDDNIEEDVYVVESIKSHLFDESGRIIFQVKWEGYDSPKDMTWEPEENLETATEIVEEYYNSIGGREYVHDQASKALEQTKNPPRKRGRTSSGAAAAAMAPKGKRGKTQKHPKNTSPPASQSNFKPPSGSWEEDVKAIDACEGTNGDVHVYLTWRDGHRTQHPLDMVYKRCPQKMLKFYESHLVFKKGGGTKKSDGAKIIESD